MTNTPDKGQTLSPSTALLGTASLSTARIEHGLYGLAFALALGIRLFRLGAAPLSDFEAGWALQALDVARGAMSATTIGPQPAYVLLTALFFWLGKEANALARLLPAISGSALVFLPLLFQHTASLSSQAFLSTRTRKAGVLLAFALALDPGMAAISRLAGSPAPAICFGLLALSLAYAGGPQRSRYQRLAGIFCGLALLTSPSLLHGALALTFAMLIAHLFERRFFAQDVSVTPGRGFKVDVVFLLFAGGTILLAGTVLLRIPQGLAALAGILGAYLRGWAQPSGTPALHIPLALLIYQPLAVIFAIIGTVRAWREADARLPRLLSLWTLLVVVLLMVYPARQVNDVAWALIPLWGLACWELTHHLPEAKDDRDLAVAGAHAVTTPLFVVMIAYNLLRLNTLAANSFQALMLIGGLILMAIIIALLVASGWSLNAARLGLVWGVSATLVIGMVGAVWGVTQLRPNGAEELWSISPAPGQIQELVSTLNDLSEWKTGHRAELDVRLAFASPALRWALRDFRTTDDTSKYSAGVSETDFPAVIITLQEQEEPRLVASYRGQDFTWSKTPGWEGLLPPDVLSWLVYRRASTSSVQVILWARTDLFPGGKGNP